MDQESSDEDDQKGFTNEELYGLEGSNLLVASWINNLGYPEKPLEDKFLFFNSETLLNNRDILEHFNVKNKKLFADKQIEFLSKKGCHNGPNQDNFFVIVSGSQGKKVKIMGLFDGHGLYGHKVSNFVMGQMADFIKHSKYFQERHINTMSEDEIQKALRKCFRFA